MTVLFCNIVKELGLAPLGQMLKRELDEWPWHVTFELLDGKRIFGKLQRLRNLNFLELAA